MTQPFTGWARRTHKWVNGYLLKPFVVHLVFYILALLQPNKLYKIYLIGKCSVGPASVKTCKNSAPREIFTLYEMLAPQISFSYYKSDLYANQYCNGSVELLTLCTYIHLYANQ